MKKIGLLSLAALIGMVALTGCYRMPTDDDYCVIPSTNNPTFTRESGSNAANMPQMGY